MYRVGVHLVAALAMLMPPGMCVCQFVPSGKATADPLLTLPRTQPAPAHSRLGCSCESCRRGVAPADQPAADDHSRANRSDDGPTRPGPVNHQPGCPAATDGIPFGVAVPTVTVQADVDLVAVSRAGDPIIERLGSLVRTLSPPARAVSPPLFISHCALLI